jgi:hypothetical protein
VIGSGIFEPVAMLVFGIVFVFSQIAASRDLTATQTGRELTLNLVQKT